MVTHPVSTIVCIGMYMVVVHSIYTAGTPNAMMNTYGVRLGGSGIMYAFLVCTNSEHVSKMSTNSMVLVGVLLTGSLLVHAHQKNNNNADPPPPELQESSTIQ